MLHTEKQIQTFQEDLMTWYRAHHRDLPWRKNKNPYHIWVSEVMLQQTQVATMLPYYDHFIRQYPDLEHLAGANLDDLLKAWEGLGYYARIRNFHKAAQKACNEMNSRIPDDPEAFQSLPGVGDYICAAVMSTAFNQALPVVDGNVKRVLARLFCLDIPINKASAYKTFKTHVQQLLNLSDPGTHNQAVMELGALICKPRNPFCNTCPITSNCNAFKTQTVEKFPVRAPSKKVPLHAIAAGVVAHNGKVLITQRKPEGLLGGLWEFPGGKINKKETSQDACVREIKEETYLNVSIREHLATVKHAYTHFKINMEVYICDYVSGSVRLNGPVDYQWVTLEELDKFAFPKANNKFIPQLKKRKNL